MTEKIPMIADVRAAAAALPPFVMDTAMGPQLVKECAARLSHSWEMDPASSPTVLTGIASSQKALALSAAMQSFGTAIVVVPEQKDIFRWEEDLAFFLPETPIYSFPLVEETGFQVTFSGSERLRDRMRTLGAMLTGRPGIILATAVEAAQKVVSPSQLEE
ncbi:MAG: transcription-repair coupling factor, partial [Dialister sp.]|nr:transcription-repair coupling factor [Dialister sp.]MDY5379477.1 transcription-repair coupling factor [Dialister sp.]